MKLLLKLITILIVLLPGNPARATVILKLDLPQLVGRADVIFTGEAIKTVSRWTADGRHIVTDTTFLVKQTIRGTQTGKTVVVRRLGGSVDGLGMQVAGSPSFKKGDQVLLFTEKRRKNRYVVPQSFKKIMKRSVERSARQMSPG
jgi:hypothetical protein